MIERAAAGAGLEHDTRAIQGWLGHRSIASAAVYSALAPNLFKVFRRASVPRGGVALKRLRTFEQ
jgi:site-specific recombinase XerC